VDMSSSGCKLWCHLLIAGPQFMSFSPLQPSCSDRSANAQDLLQILSFAGTFLQSGFVLGRFQFELVSAKRARIGDESFLAIWGCFGKVKLLLQ